MAKATSLQMSWQDLHRRKGSPLGLKNLGNSCYLNSVLQCLTYTPPLANFCLLNDHSSSCTSINDTGNSVCPFCLLEKRISRSLSIDAASDSPAGIYGRLSLFAKHFRQGWQEDAHEFLRYVIEACNNVCVKLHKLLSASKLRTRQDTQKSKEEPRTIVKDIFGGVLQSQVKCLSCNVESNKLDDIMDLSLEVYKITSVKDALCRYFQPEVLDGSNKYRCEKCKKLSAARKQMSVYQAPNVLVIQLKRFENIYGGKTDRHISFEEQLDLFKHMCRSSEDQRPEYILYGIIVHSGHSQDSGHYYSYVKDTNGKWFCCNDALVTAVSAKSVLLEKAYILFYVRQAKKVITKSTEASQNGKHKSTLAAQAVGELAKTPAKENGVGEKSNMAAGISCNGQGLHHVRFNILKPGQSRKPFNNENKRAMKVIADSEQEKPSHDVNRVTSNGSSTHSVHEQDHVDDGYQEKRTFVNGGSHPASLLSSPEAVAEKLESNGHNLGVPMLTNAQIMEPNIKNSSGSLSSCSGIVEPQQESTKPLPITAGINFSTDRSKTLGRTEAMFQSCGGVKRKASNGSFLDNQLEGDELGAAAVNKEVGSESLPIEVSDLETLKLWLASNSRDWLLRSGWCDRVRDSFRQLKKTRVEEVQSRDGERRLGSDIFSSVHDSLRQQVPKELKEHLVKQLHAHFALQGSKER